MSWLMLLAQSKPVGQLEGGKMQEDKADRRARETAQEAIDELVKAEQEAMARLAEADKSKAKPKARPKTKATSLDIGSYEK